MIYVCSLQRVPETVTRVGASRLISLLAAGTEMARPESLATEHHLLLNFHDIAEPQEGLTPPSEAVVRRILEFGENWDARAPLVVNCFAGISRSTASAYMIAAARSPARDEQDLAREVRRLSPTATPNPLMIALADAMLGRNGRMVRAIRDIGRGEDVTTGEGVPFALSIDARS
jgi:predicted protein tyrosine phosphatase